MIVTGPSRRRAALPYLAFGLLLVIWFSTKWRTPVKLYDWAIDSEDNTAGDIPLFHSQPDSHVDAVSPKEKFIAAALNTPLEQEWNPVYIQKFCSSKTWKKDVVFRCDQMNGGVSNIRQEVLTCIRWTMEAGAAIIFPQIMERVATNASEVVYHRYENYMEFDSLFDATTLSTRLKEACPQMTVYPNIEAIKGLGQLEEVGTFILKRHAHKDEMGPFVNAWIDEHRAGPGNITLVNFDKQMAEYEVCEDGAELADTFGHLVTYRNDTTRLASAVLYELITRFNIAVDPSSMLLADAFVGIHLRTSADAVSKNWLSFEKQVQWYGVEVAKYNLPTIYVASGNLTSIDLFAASVGSIPVVTKDTLLSGEDLDLLHSLTWDQQAEVDFQVLVKSTLFLGMTDSSFSWGISNARRAVGERGTCSQEEIEDLGENNKPKPVEKGIAYKDELSVIIGRPNKFYFRTRLWP